MAARLVPALIDLYPDSVHVEALGLLGAPDRAIWARAGAEGFVLVTKDEDFHRLSVLLGTPPKVIWLRVGNCTTARIASLLRAQFEQVRAFVDHEEAAFLVLGSP